MRKIYEAPIMEITEYTNESIITVSGALVGKGGITGLINGNAGINEINTF